MPAPSSSTAGPAAGSSARLRILSVIDTLAQGGAERSLVELLAPLRRHGVDVDVVVLADREAMRADAEAAGARVLSVDGPGGLLGRTARLRALVRRRRPDLVHTTLFGSALAGRTAARLAGVPVVSSLVNTPYGPDHRSQPGLSSRRVRAAQAADAATARLVRRFHANAGHVADTMAGRLRIPRSRIDVVHRGRDPGVLGLPSAERRSRVRAALGLGAGTVVLAVARHEHQKGLDLLLTAAAELDEATVVVAGREGNATPGLRLQASALHLDERVRFLGYRRDVGDLLAAADVLALPSRREGFPGVVVEAMALSTPVVASDLPGTREALGSAVGLLVPSEDPVALAKAVDEVRRDPDAARARARRGRQRFLDEFTVDTSARRMASLFRRAAERAP